MTIGQNRFVVPSMTLCRGDEADTAVAMLVVVPLDEVVDPDTGGAQAGKAAYWPLRAVLQRPEQGFRIGVVVAHPGSAPRRGDAQLIQLGQQGRRLST